MARFLLLLLTAAACAQLPLNIAHRGGAGEAPEETIEACRAALEAGADWLELDLHRTADGVLVCSHDATVDRTTDGRGAIAAMTFAELSELDAGWAFSPDGESSPFRGTGVRIPTLRAVLEAFPGQRFVLEVKQRQPSMMADLVTLLDELGARERVIVGAMREGMLSELRALAPGLRTGYGPLELVGLELLPRWMEDGYTPPAEALFIPEWMAEPRLVSRCARLGLEVYVWTVNDRATMRRLIELGVDGIITDHPTRLEAVLEEFRTGS